MHASKIIELQASCLPFLPSIQVSQMPKKPHSRHSIGRQSRRTYLESIHESDSQQEGQETTTPPQTTPQFTASFSL